MAEDTEDLSGAVPATSVQDEYAKIHAEPCACGGPFSPAAGMKGIDIGGPPQTLVVKEDQGKAYDVMRAACLSCGAKRRYVFDVSSFYFRSRRGAVVAREAAAEPAPTPWTVLQVLAVGSLLLLFCIKTPFNIFTIFAFPLGVMFVYYGTCDAWALARGLPEPAGGEPPRIEQAAGLDGALGTFGIPPGANSVSTPQDALLDGMAGASLLGAMKRIEEGDRDGALSSVQKLLETMKLDSPRRLELAGGARVFEGMLLEGAGRKDDAIASYRKAQELHPQNAKAGEALARLGAG